MAKSAGIVIIGDEILSGKFADENSPFLIGQLRALGVSLRRVVFIPDDVAEIGEAVRYLSHRFEYVFTSGGVGPTHDDVTMAGVARGFSTGVTHHPDLEAMLREHMGEAMTPTHLRFAEVPEGAHLVFGDGATWPVVAYRNVYILPGVPAIFRRKFLSIRKHFQGEPFVVGRLHCGGDESGLAGELTDAVAAFPEVKFGSYPRDASDEAQVIITVESQDGDRARAAFDDLRARLAPLIHRVDDPAPTPPPDD